MEAVRVNAKEGYATVNAGAGQNNVSVGVARRITRYRGVSVDPSKPGSGYVDLTPEAALQLANAILAAIAEALPEGLILGRSFPGDTLAIVDVRNPQ